MSAVVLRGKFFRLAGIVALVALATGFAGCTFFGRKDAPVPSTTPGQLANGTSFVGSWSTSIADISTSGNPHVAVTTTFTFNPDGSAVVDSRDLHQGGVDCTGFGQFRTVGTNNVVVYMQAGNCAVQSQYTLSNIQVNANYLSYDDPASGNTYFLWGAHNQDNPPVGVWNFSGALGIDYVLFDPHGYFILQTTENGSAFLLEGYYGISNGAILLTYFNNGDPGQVLGTQEFTDFLSNGTQLVLEQTTNSGTTTGTGVRQ